MPLSTVLAQLDRPNGGIHPLIKPAVVEVCTAADKAGHGVAANSWYNPASTPEHHVPGMALNKGVANDFMVYYNKAAGDWIADYLWEHRARLGVCWIIWNGRIRSTSRGKSGEWTKYNGDDQHTNHVHVNFGRLVGTNGYGSVPKVTYRPLTPAVWDGHSFPGADAFVLGQSHPAVLLLDQRLVEHGFTRHREGSGYEPDTTFTEYTRLNVQDAQLAQGFTGTEPGGDADGYCGQTTWDFLLADPVQPPLPEPKPEPKPEPIVQVEHTSFHFGNWNIFGAQRSTFHNRLPAIVKEIRALGVSVFALQECFDDEAAAIQAELGPDWMWRNENDLAIFYKKTVWKEVGNDTKLVVKLPNPHSGKYVRFILLVLLTNIKTGEKVWFGSTHLTANNYPPEMTDAQGFEERGLQSTGIVRVFAKLPVRKAFVVFGGDINSTSKVGRAGAPRTIFRDAGLRPLTERADVINRTGPTHDSGSQIDDIWIGKGLGFYKGGEIRKDSPGSDHRAEKAAIWIRKEEEIA